MRISFPDKALPRIAIFAVALAVLFGVAAGVGRLVSGDSMAADGHSGHGTGSGGHDHGSEGGGGHEHSTSSGTQSAAVPGGASRVQGYAISSLTTTVAGTVATISFQITGRDGAPVTQYDVVHEKELHLIATRDDLSGFNHVHPTRSSDGTWSAQLQVSPGTWRLYVDSQPAALDEQVVLSATMLVPGVANPIALPEPATTAEVDGYTVTVDGDLAVGEQGITFSITRDGQDVTDLRPYLGSYAHVVILRADDGAYNHVHPMPGPAGPTIETHIEFEKAGPHRAYIEFLHAGSLHRAEVTLLVK